jgi:hypothetical protein
MSETPASSLLDAFRGGNAQDSGVFPHGENTTTSWTSRGVSKDTSNGLNSRYK